MLRWIFKVVVLIGFYGSQFIFKPVKDIEIFCCFEFNKDNYVMINVQIFKAEIVCLFLFN